MARQGFYKFLLLNCCQLNFYCPWFDLPGDGFTEWPVYENAPDVPRALNSDFQPWPHLCLLYVFKIFSLFVESTGPCFPLDRATPWPCPLFASSPLDEGGDLGELYWTLE